MTQREIDREANEYGEAAAITLPLVFAAFFILAVVILATPTHAAERGYTFHNVDRMADAFVPLLKARWGCPSDWDYRTHGWEDCRPGAAHKDLDAYDKAAKAARRLFP